MKSNKIKSSWSDLLSELVVAIAGNLTEFTDHLRFRSVCSHWRSSFHSHSHSLRLPPQLPWLTLPSTSSTHLYSLSEDRVYCTPPPSVADNSNLLGSASGWFLSVSIANTFSLINPFTGAIIGLPSPHPCSPLSIMRANKFVWDRSDSVVVVGCSTRSGVFYCRLGDAAWASIESQQDCLPGRITFCEGRFYILQVETCDTVVLDGETLEQITVIDGPILADPELDISVVPHLFVLSGELLLLFKSTWTYCFPDLTDPDSHLYEVLGVNLNNELMEWIEVRDIGDHALLVDNLHCFSVKVGDNCLLRRNCIYSAQSKTSDDGWTTYRISICDLGKQNEERLQGALRKFPAFSASVAISPPSWVLPSFS